MRDEIISLLREAVSYHTIAGKKEAKEECLDWIEQTFLERPSKADGERLSRGEIEDAPYLFAQHPNPKLLWFAHIDVVPGSDEQFTLREDGDKLYGRGTSDMKGNALPFLMAYRDAVEEGNDPPVSILLTSDEETAGPTIPTLLKEKKLGDIPVAFTPDTADRIVVEHKGVAWCELTCTGKGAHAAYSWDGDNPSFLLAEALKNIQEAFPPGTKDDWQITVTPTTLRGSDAQNQIPDVATCGIDIRFPPEDYSSPEVAVDAVRAVLPEGCDLTITISADPLQTDPEHPMVQLVKTIAEDVTGKEVVFEREHGGTDARYFSAAGIPAFLYGPVGAGLHGANEWVSLKSLEQQYQMSSELLQKL